MAPKAQENRQYKINEDTVFDGKISVDFLTPMITKSKKQQQDEQGDQISKPVPDKRRTVIITVDGFV